MKDYYHVIAGRRVIATSRVEYMFGDLAMRVWALLTTTKVVSALHEALS